MVNGREVTQQPLSASPSGRPITFLCPVRCALCATLQDFCYMCAPPAKGAEDKACMPCKDGNPQGWVVNTDGQTCDAPEEDATTAGDTDDDGWPQEGRG